MSMLPPMSARLPMTVIWSDEDTIQLLVYDREAWRGDCSVLDLLKQLEELDYITLSMYDSEDDYLNRDKQ
jgi:hypothetical protein